MTDTNYLKALMIYRKDNVRKLCKDTGRQESNIGQKVRGMKEFRQSDMAIFIERHKLTPEQVVRIWFPELYPELTNGAVTDGLAL